MAVAERLPCSTEVHALHVAADGALWANTCSRLFHFDGQRFQPIAGLSGMLSGAQRMADDGQGGVLVATPSGLYPGDAGRRRLVLRAPPPVEAPYLPARPCTESRGTVRSSGSAAAPG
jgi:ligand-binding sensor domain-containing protein